MKRGQWVLAHDENSDWIWINLGRVDAMQRRSGYTEMFFRGSEDVARVQQTPEALLAQLGGDE